MEKTKTCPYCHGSGKAPNTQKTCPVCHGRKQIKTPLSR